MNPLPWKTVVGFALSVIVAVCMLAILTFSFITTNRTPAPDTSSYEAISTSTPPIVLLYSEKIDEIVTTADRTVPVLNLWQKIGSSTPILLAKVGKANEYPIYFSLSPNKKYLSIDLESKLQILNLETKELKTVFTPTQQVGGAGVFSPDSTKIAVVDASQYYFRDRPKSILHSIDLETGTDTVLHQSTSALYDDAIRWRPDGTIILATLVPKDCVGLQLAYYSPKDKSVHPMLSGTLSDNGMLIAVENPTSQALSFPDMCGDTIDRYTIFDPIASTTVLGVIAQAGQVVRILGFSPDNAQVLFESSVYSSDLSTSTRSYYVQTLSESQPVVTPDPVRVFASWRASDVGAKTGFGQDGYEPNEIIVDGQTLVSSSNPLGIIAQYWQ